MGGVDPGGRGFVTGVTMKPIEEMADAGLRARIDVRVHNLEA
jgi:hypothetical protein